MGKAMLCNNEIMIHENKTEKVRVITFRGTETKDDMIVDVTHICPTSTFPQEKLEAYYKALTEGTDTHKKDYLNPQSPGKNWELRFCGHSMGATGLLYLLPVIQERRTTFKYEYACFYSIGTGITFDEKAKTVFVDGLNSKKNYFFINKYDPVSLGIINLFNSVSLNKNKRGRKKSRSVANKPIKAQLIFFNKSPKVNETSTWLRPDLHVCSSFFMSHEPSVGEKCQVKVKTRNNPDGEWSEDGILLDVHQKWITKKTKQQEWEVKLDSNGKTVRGYDIMRVKPNEATWDYKKVTVFLLKEKMCAPKVQGRRVGTETTRIIDHLSSDRRRTGNGNSRISSGKRS